MLKAARERANRLRSAARLQESEVASLLDRLIANAVEAATVAGQAFAVVTIPEQIQNPLLHLEVPEPAFNALKARLRRAGFRVAAAAPDSHPRALLLRW